jgi:AcrR family transcriptional regulator
MSIAKADTKMPTATKSRRTQAERTAATRSALLRAARDLFAERGYAATGREEIAERAGVTRGALYHHFDSKADVFTAVVEQLQTDLVDRVVAASKPGRTAVEKLRRSCRAYIDASAEARTARILVDAPAVLGADVCRAMDAESCVPLLEGVFALASAEGVALPGDPQVAALLVLGMLNEAATLVASAPVPAAERGRVTRTVEAFLSRVLGIPA